MLTPAQAEAVRKEAAVFDRMAQMAYEIGATRAALHYHRKAEALRDGVA